MNGGKGTYVSPVARAVPFDNVTNSFNSLTTQSAVEESAIMMWLGDGSDGDVSLSAGTTTLTRTMFYNSLTLSGTAIIETNGYAIHVRNTCAISGTAVIRNNGGAGGNGTGNTAPGTGGVAAPGVDYGVSLQGVGGGAADRGAGGTTQAWSGYGGAGGVGGNGGSTGTGVNPGGIAGTVGAYTYQPERVVRRDHIQNIGYKTVGQAGSGGAGGRGGNGGDGGGSGGGGGAVIIFARTFTNTSSLGVQAEGGKGGNGGAAVAATNGGGGAGGGGGGGFIYIVALDVTLGVVSVAGGLGGTGGAGNGAGASAGFNGAAGSSGHYSVYSARTGAWTVL